MGNILQLYGVLFPPRANILQLSYRVLGYRSLKGPALYRQPSYTIMEYSSLKGPTLYSFYSDHYRVLSPQEANFVQLLYRSLQSIVPSRVQLCIAFIQIIMEYCSLKWLTLYSLHTDHGVLFPQGANSIAFIQITMEYCSLKGLTLQPSYRSWSIVPSRDQFYSF